MIKECSIQVKFTLLSNIILILCLECEFVPSWLDIISCLSNVLIRKTLYWCPISEHRQLTCIGHSQINFKCHIIFRNASYDFRLPFQPFYAVVTTSIWCVHLWFSLAHSISIITLSNLSKLGTLYEGGDSSWDLTWAWKLGEYNW